jgi:hypothetical protein
VKICRENLHTNLPALARVRVPSSRSDRFLTADVTPMDLLFLVIIGLMYGLTHALLWAVARLGGES